MSIRWRRGEGARQWENSPEKKKPLFFKIIHSSIIRDRKLGIPKKFVRKHGKNLSDGVVLKVPNGNVWHVRLRKVDGEVWLQSGWQEFVEYHSICAGHFLVFRLDGNSLFNVLIFDMSGNETHYRSNSDNFDEPKYDREEIEGEDSAEIFGGSSCNGSPSKQDSIGTRVARRHLYTRALRTIEEDGLIQTASAFSSKNPFFTTTMHPAYVNHRYMAMPIEFTARYLAKTIECIRLQASDGRSWLVRCIHIQKFTRLGKGWGDFVRENNLEVGDVCVFEMIKKDTVLKVHVFPQK